MSDMKAIVGLLSLFAISPLVHADSVPKEIKARYAELDKVMRKLDFKGFQSFFSKDFVNVDPAGKSVSYNEFMDMVKPMFTGSTKGEPSEKLKSAKVHDGQIDVSFDFIFKLTGKSGAQTIHEVGVDCWKKVNGKYVMIKTVDTKFDVIAPKAAGTKKHG